MIRFNEHSMFTPVVRSLKNKRDRSFGERNKNDETDLSDKGARNRSCSPVVKSTVGLVKTFQNCNKNYKYSKHLNPRRSLTKNCKPVKTGAWDNDESDLILIVHDTLKADDGTTEFKVISMLGQGSFGQVAKCQVLEGGVPVRDAGSKDGSRYVAVKVVKNKPAYYKQALVEARILRLLNVEEDHSTFKSKFGRRIVKLLDCFEFQNHLCIVFELLSMNLYELIKQNKFRGLSINFIEACMTQLTDALDLLAELDIVHCDLKPENILLEGYGSTKIQLIDFGSSCFKDQTIYTYIQSRFYRSPEILVGLPYSEAIDIWSLGCIAVELFMGLPVFPGVSEHNQVLRITEMLGDIPQVMVMNGRNRDKLFTPGDKGNYYRVKTPEEWAKQQGLESEEVMKRYVAGITLEDLILKGCNRDDHADVINDENMHPGMDKMLWRECFMDFVKGLLRVDPQKRWTAWQANRHPFLSKKRFDGPFEPPSKSARDNTSSPAPIPKSSDGTTPLGSVCQPANELPGLGLQFSPDQKASWFGFQPPPASMFQYGFAGGYGNSPMSPLSRPGHPFPLSHESSWQGCQYLGATDQGVLGAAGNSRHRATSTYMQSAYSSLQAPEWYNNHHHYASCPADVGASVFHNPNMHISSAVSQQFLLRPYSVQPFRPHGEMDHLSYWVPSSPLGLVPRYEALYGSEFKESTGATNSIASSSEDGLNGVQIPARRLSFAVNDNDDDDEEGVLFSLSPDSCQGINDIV
uniref:Protein kinase domain-containing protein n=1 Tax=Mucochytrium quahogii TaxID=96639 RepID=A0A7S2W416_9STRA|mmetsp:Transcript_2930/g.4214  ORF Transcript_2930/g.4214 Transcript_2930/m.4214 type:complete len:747 (+) Transcript_2930:447-2687(+)|eukprot:CAMPEP_0203781954 /NCGR_PEP_ID=MMETSP0099_2-20121227/10647_1 /ASSEMBLY_ACC=CAM_ASM_000209 /TAXON_ID=96639 /ORGANISM=" , Strain NY0313808BC1" /LENGTH=746 /DNA_ID=CAMNT_0050683247 /DNA_START=1224 /DNA_END=3464 /DNA_ORIENTATION=+